MKKNSMGLPTFSVVLKMLGTYFLVVFGLIIFRSASIAEAGMIMKKIATEPGGLFFDPSTLINGILCMLILFFKDFRDEFLPNKHLFSAAVVERYRYELTVSTYIILVIFFGVFDGGQFIYFKF